MALLQNDSTAALNSPRAGLTFPGMVTGKSYTFPTKSRSLKPLRSRPTERSLECDHTVIFSLSSCHPGVRIALLRNWLTWFADNLRLISSKQNFVYRFSTWLYNERVSECVCVRIVIRSPLPSLHQKGPNDYARRFAGSAGCARICLAGRESCQHEATGWQVMKS